MCVIIWLPTTVYRLASNLNFQLYNKTKNVIALKLHKGADEFRANRVT